MSRKRKPKREAVTDDPKFDTAKLSRETLSFCGHDRGGCQCGMIWTERGGHLATVTIGKWGDSWPSLRFVEDGKPGSILPKVEPYLEHDYYGEVSLRRGQAVMARLVQCWNALRGIPNPDRFVAEAKKLRRARH